MNYKILLMLFLTLFFINGASALSFSNLSVGGTGSINTANGYFDNAESAFNYTGQRNVYAIIEDTQINLIEPLSWTTGFLPTTYIAINSSLGTLKDAVAHKGYLYFVDGTTLKKKKTRDFTTPQSCESTDTTIPTGCIVVVATGVGPTLRVYNNVLYFMVGTNLKHLDALDNVVSNFIITPVPAGAGTNFASFTIASPSNTLTLYLVGYVAPSNKLYACTSASCTAIATISGNTGVSSSTLYTTSTHFYVLDYQAGGGNENIESEYYINNNTAISVNYASNNLLVQSSRAYVGGLSVIGLIAQSATDYETYNSNEIGTDSLATVPPQITYDTKTIGSLQSTYYNKSDIYLEYNIVINSLDINNLGFLSDFGDYRWMISLTDPNGVSQDIIQSQACWYDRIIDPTCQVTSTMGLHAPSNGWLAGSWTAKLYEVNIVNPNRALLTTSTAFTVLNTSLENQSIAPPTFEPPTSGTSPQTISIIDGVVGYFNIGVNATSKLLFSMVIIALCIILGLIYGKPDIAMVLGFLPYAFFMYIDYLPKWTFVIFIIMLVIYSKVFR